MRRGSMTISLAPFAKPFLQPRSEHRMPVGRVGADHDHHIGMFDRIEILRAGRSAEGLAETVTGRRVTDSRAGVGVVVAENRPRQLLHQEGFLIGTARRGDHADGVLAVCLLQPAHPGRREAHRFFPRHLAPRLVDGLADHRIENAVLVIGIAIGETALDATMAAVRLAVLVRHHPHQFLAAHFRLERAADAAIGAGRHHGMFRLADLDDRFFRQRRRRAGLHAGAAGNAFRSEEILMHAGRNAAVESPALDRQREGALHFLAGAHAARADYAFGRIVGEIGIGLVLRHPAHVRLVALARRDMIVALVAIAYVAQADRTGHVLQLAVAIGGTGQAVERMVGNIEFHHTAADVLQLARLGVDDHAVGDRRRAGRRRAVAALDLDQAKPARAECVDHVGGAQFRHLDAGLRRGAHHRRAFGHGHLEAVDGQRDGLFRPGSRGSEIRLLNQAHDFTPQLAGRGFSGSRPGNGSARSSPGRV